ncbi:unnamed protein product [Dicrocoelium dendriticum]|nr:unnamed protein product [Dicrocoelium dendriticum]
MDVERARTSSDSDDSNLLQNINTYECAPASTTVRSPIELTIPRAILRKDSVHGSYILYTIHIRISQVEKVDATGSLSSIQNTIHEWTIEHRYSTLAKLHADLMGWTKPTSDSDSPVNELYAHWCLPRPLPGLQRVQFPRKRRIPTLLPPPSYRWWGCTMKPTVEDTALPAGKSGRVDQRRRDLEMYLANLVDLVWKISSTDTVANVYSSMTATADAANQSNYHGFAANHQIEAIKERFTNLLPILKPQL